MALTFNIKKPPDLQAVFAKAKDSAVKNNISWKGNAWRGCGSGFGFTANYVVNGDCITISVVKKPPFVSNAKIEAVVRKYFLTLTSV